MINGVSSSGALPAVTVLSISPRRTVNVSAPARGREAVAADQHPPRREELSQLSALLPEVLARYGINAGSITRQRFEAVA